MRRLNLLFFFFALATLLVIARLFYWQIAAGEKMAILAETQRISQVELPARRGRIFTADGYPLVDNQEGFLVYADLTKIEDPISVAAQLASILEMEEEVIKSRLLRPNLAWVALKRKVKKPVKVEIEKLALSGIGFEKESLRFYPEASLSAHLLGIVGSDESGHDQGYFGVEGYYDLELKGRPGVLFQEKDVFGQPILVGYFEKEEAADGHDLVLHLNRFLQFMVEEELKAGLEKYGAKAGSVTIIEPKTGAILAMAALPDYEPGRFQDYPKELFKNPVVADSFEPGSIFKVIVMAAALDQGVINPETRCDRCAGPRKIGPHIIHTYDDQYYPESTVTEILAHSDNVGMVFVAEKLGQEKMIVYLKRFGFGRLTGVDLEEEMTPSLRPDKEWREIDLAAAGFGQGIAVTPIQMVRAVAAIANEGKLLKPRIVAKVRRGEKVIEINPEVVHQVIKPETAKTITRMMVNAVENGFPHWKQYGLTDFKIAGKTGTAQIPIAGHYDEEKTIASFIGFAPADQPRFVMLVTLREPTSSPWGANTAAPLWFKIAQKILLHYGISPED